MKILGYKILYFKEKLLISHILRKSLIFNILRTEYWRVHYT
jgi:hypothetical protein